MPTPPGSIHGGRFAAWQQSVVASLSDSELAEFREIFDLVDRDGGGTISKRELASLLDTLGVGTSAVGGRGSYGVGARGAGLTL